MIIFHVELRCDLRQEDRSITNKRRPPYNARSHLRSNSTPSPHHHSLRTSSSHHTLILIPRDVSTPGDPFQYADSTNGTDPDTPYVRGYSKNGVQGPGPDQRRREMKADEGGQMCF